MSFLRAESRRSIQWQVVVVINLVLIDFRLFVRGLRGLPVGYPVVIVVDRALHEISSARYESLRGCSQLKWVASSDLTVDREIKLRSDTHRLGFCVPLLLTYYKHESFADGGEQFYGQHSAVYGEQGSQRLVPVLPILARESGWRHAVLSRHLHECAAQ